MGCAADLLASSGHLSHSVSETIWAGGKPHRNNPKVHDSILSCCFGLP
jgi:hypothetical protein